MDHITCVLGKYDAKYHWSAFRSIGENYYFSILNLSTMKFYLALFFILTIAYTTAQPVSPERGSVMCSQGKSARQLNRVSTMAPLPRPANVLSYDLEANFYHCFLPPYPNSFNATVNSTLLTLSATDSIQFNASNSSLVVEAVWGDAVSFVHSANILTLYLDHTFQPGDTIDFTIRYHHNDINDNAFYASNGFVFTDFEPEGARNWFPCYDSPDDKALFSIKAGTPATAKLGSNGILADSVMNGDTLVYHWVSDNNVATYLMVVSASVNYDLDIVYWPRTSNPNDSVEFRFYYQPNENPGPTEAVMMDVAAFFSDIYCDHPFPKNGFATVGSEFSWGGMENQTLTSLCAGCWGEFLAVHEFSHQWFGDMITCKTWADIWLNEGFATYSESLWAEYAYGYNLYKQDVLSNASAYLNGNPRWAISNPEWAVTTPSSDVLFNYSVTYAKGACIHHLLRYTVGDSLYFEVMKQYAQSPLLQYESAEIADFIDVVNNVTGEDYQWFFDQWVFEPNHPVYNNVYWIEQLPDQRWRVTFTVHQIQSIPDFFRMPIELRIIGQDGLDTTFRVMNNENNESFVFESDKKITKLFFDFNNEIVLKQGTTIVGESETASGKPVLDVVTTDIDGQLVVRIMTGDRAQAGRLTLLDLTGRVVRDFSSMYTGDNSYRLPVNGLSSGVYLLCFDWNGQPVTRKVFVK
ncbi:MAG: hypothetical protein CVU06_03240 [Bacteroidetes bacterium HGW-Bacteroidetes-22]|nr:MAG: hypothetical protein CVU06_03240 [Bacteroidetes bacterium HGW-Bacteroidetes-22]